MKRSRWALGVLLLVLAIGLLALLAACGGDEETTTTAAPDATTTTAVESPSTTAGNGVTTTVAAGPAGTFKIGLINSVTGMMAPGLANVSASVPLVEAFVNSKGGITVDGQQYLIEIVAEDDMSTQEGAIAAAKKLIADGITVILAPQNIPYNMAIASVCEEAKVLRLVAGAPDFEQYGTSQYEFATASTGIGMKSVHDKVLSLYPDIKKISMVAVDDPGLVVLTAAAEADFKSRGLEVVFMEKFPPDVQDMYPIITKALAAEPDAIAFPAAFPPLGKGILESAREMGFTGPVFASAALGDPNQLNALFDPKYATDFAAQMMDVNSSALVPLVQELGKMSADMNMDFQCDYVNTWNSVWILKQGIEQAQSFDTEKITSALESMDSIDTMCGPGSFVGAESVGGFQIGKNRIMNTPVPWYRIMNAKIEFEFLPKPE